ncbi:hypothetical protein BYT27DRAFT_7261370 [Phlegmacium glaucopus]|nr:hypothetical protein BYT27DRAFT_7261370 [Phlegmacium glaucopus]
MIKTITMLRSFFTEALLKTHQSPQDKVFEFERHYVPPTFTPAVLELSPWQDLEVFETEDNSESPTFTVLELSSWEDLQKPSAFFSIPLGDAGFYGHKWISKSTSAFITTTFGCAEESLLSHILAQPSLPCFIAFIIHKTHAPFSVIFATLVFLRRYQSQLPPGFDSSKTAGHLLFIASYIYAVREHWPRNQKIFDNEYWSQISNFKANEIRLLVDGFHNKVKGKFGVYSRFRTIMDVPILIMGYHGADSEKLSESDMTVTKVSSILTRSGSMSSMKDERY